MIFRDRRHMTPIRAGATLALLLCVPATCMDLTPVTYTPAGSSAAPLEAGDCRACIYAVPDAGQPGCGDLVATCNEDSQCAAIFDCIRALGCLEVTDPFAQKICGVPCAQDAGITSADSPKLQLLLAIQDCEQATCPACAGGDR
jgi:hypothetical protein